MRTLAAILAVALTGLGAPLSVSAAPPRVPVVAVDAPQTSNDAFVVFYSGDGGWAHSDKSFTTALNAEGLPVAGVDSLRYFWRRRSAQSAAEDLAQVIDTYAAHWGKRRVILAGYSFGAAALPQIVPALPARERAMVKSVVLIAPTDFSYLVLRPGSWLNIKGPHAADIAPSLAAMQDIPVICIWGQKDRVAACPRLSTGLVHRREVAGGHRFVGEYGAVARIIASPLTPRPSLENL